MSIDQVSILSVIVLQKDSTTIALWDSIDRLEVANLGLCAAGPRSAVFSHREVAVGRMDIHSLSISRLEALPHSLIALG